MATSVYTTEEVELQDGTTLLLKPNVIKRQKRFMNKMESLESPETQIEAYDQILDLAEICLEGINPELAADREKMEDVLDEPTIYKIIEVCGGIKLDDPNLLAAAAANLIHQEDGQN